MLNKPTFLQRVFMLAALHRLSNESVLEKVGLDKNRISELTKGDVPDIDEVILFAKALEYPVDLLWDTSPTPLRTKLEQCYDVFVDMAGSSQKALRAYNEMAPSVKAQAARGDVQQSDEYFRRLYRQSEVGKLDDSGTSDDFRDVDFI